MDELRLVKAEIDGYGTLHDRQFHLDAPFVLLYGPNEAGKSTMLSFLRAMLYGFGKRGQPLERQEPVHGGKHGGMLLFQDSTGGLYRLERYATDGTGKLKIRRLSDSDHVNSTESHAAKLSLMEQIWTQEQFESQFLGGIQERLFRQIFAITLTELQEIGALSGDELGQYLYQAGWDSGKQIIAAEKQLVQEMDALFKGRGINQPINQHLKALDDAEARLRKRADAITFFNELKEELAAVEEMLLILHEKRPQLESRLLLLNKANTVRETWLQKRNLQEQRRLLVYASGLPLGAQRSWTELIQQRDEMEEQLQRLELQMRLNEQKQAALTYDEQLLARAGETEALLQSAERMRAIKLACGEQKNELEAMDEAIARLVTSISPEWTERQLRELQMTVTDRDYVRAMRERQMEQLRTTERFEAELATLEQQEREAAYALEEAELINQRASRRTSQERASRFVLLPQSKGALQEAWNTLETALRKWELAQLGGIEAWPERLAGDGRRAGNSSGVSAKSRSAVWLWGAGIAGGAALALAGFRLGGGTASSASDSTLLILTLALGGTAAVLAAMSWLLRRRSTRPNASSQTQRLGAGGVELSLHAQERAVRSALAGLLREPAEAAASLLMDHAAAGTELPSREHSLAVEQARAELRGAVQAELEALRDSERLHDQRSELARRLERLRKLMSERRIAFAAAREAYEAAAREWGGWLAERALPPAMTAQAALEAFELAEQALQRLREYDRLAAKHSAAQKELAAYMAKAAVVCSGYAEPERQLEQDAVLAMHLLQRELAQQQAKREQAEQCAAELAELALQRVAAESRTAELQQQLQAALGQAGLASEAAYASALEDRERLEALELELSRLELELTVGLSGERKQELELLFEENDQESLQEQQREAEAAYRQHEQELRHLLEQKGRFSQSLEHLLQEEEHQKLLVHREMTTAQLEQDVERYAVMAISTALIRKVKQVYEEERQPVVLKHASRMISIMTDGRYIRVLSVPGETRIRLEQENGQLVDSTVLSRGTAEQLYLVMRLALAIEATKSIKLPLLLDDLFVNFDRTRLAAAARLIAELAHDRQIIFFTCHEHVREALLEACKHAELIELDRVLS